MKLCVFRIVPLSIIGSLFTVHSAMVYVIQVCRQLSSRTRSCLKAVYKPVWHILLLSVQWINSQWWTEELSETRRVSCQNKSVKLMHLFGFIIKKWLWHLTYMGLQYRICFMSLLWWLEFWRVLPTVFRWFIPLCWNIKTMSFKHDLIAVFDGHTAT